ncbi:MAG: trigger factor [Alphaproteobacteria bacterium]|nr:trigger factor [Alphaproteobacteria bacterium]
MNIKEVKTEGLRHDLEIKVPANDIATMVEAELLKVGKNVKVPGFRPGKVPLPVLKQKYGRHVMADVLEKAVNESTIKAMEEKGLKPAMQPKIEVKEFDEGKDLTYTMSVEVLPEFKVMDLSKITAEKPVAKVEDKVLKETLDNIASNNSELTAITTKRAAKKGDVVKIDFHGKRADGVEFDGMDGHDHDLELGAGQFIPGFEDQITGKKVGDKVEVKVTFPKEYGMKDLAGQGAVFDVDVKEIQEKKPAEINDALAKKLGLEDEKALRTAVEEQIAKDYASFTKMKLKKNILDALDKEHSFELPKTMIEQEQTHIEEQLKREAEAQGEEFSSKEGEYKDLAERRVRLGLVLAEIGRDQKIEVSQQELQQAVITEAQKYPGQEKMVFDYYGKNPQVLESLKAPIYEDKVINAITEVAKITEKTVSVEALTADDEDIPAAKKKAPAKKKATTKKKTEKTEK